jgi:microcystin degradation protein MlrC
VVQHTATLEGGDVLSVAYLAGFPPSDLAECGPSAIAYGWTQTAADRAADAVMDDGVRREDEFTQPMLDPDTAVKEAMRIAVRATRPVVIADTQDNPGAGGTGDSTGMLAALVRNEAKGAALGFFFDPDAATAAHAAGEDAEIDIALGGHFGIEGDAPYRARFVVERLRDGKLMTTGPSVGGRQVDLGPMALLRIGGVRVVVTTRRMQAHDQAPFRHMGVEPAQQKILVLKSTAHFRADFQPIAEEVLVAVAPGGHIVDPSRYPYQRLRPGVKLYPGGPLFKAR